MVSCLIVDDEPIARDIVVAYCHHLPVLQVLASCGNALEARQVLQQQSVDILFLDIHMPVLDGIGFLKTLKNRPQVIFTTAYQEYAVAAFDLAACDYLVKPFSLERFMMAVDKALEGLQLPPRAAIEEKADVSAEHFFLKADGKIFNLHYKDILFAEAQGNYTRVVTGHSSLLPMMSFSAMEAMLPAGLFVRVHRSFIINTSKITHIEGNTVFLGRVELPVGTHYKEAFLKSIGL